MRRGFAWLARKQFGDDGGHGRWKRDPERFPSQYFSFRMFLKSKKMSQKTKKVSG